MRKETELQDISQVQPSCLDDRGLARHERVGFPRACTPQPPNPRRTSGPKRSSSLPAQGTSGISHTNSKFGSLRQHTEKPPPPSIRCVYIYNTKPVSLSFFPLNLKHIHMESSQLATLYETRAAYSREGIFKSTIGERNYWLAILKAATTANEERKK